MTKTKVLIAVKTYPTISGKYDELVCTAGFLEDGSWIRIYPVPFRKKEYKEQYRKYDWVEIELVKNKSDFRPESYRPYSLESEIEKIGHLDTAGNWRARKDIVFKKGVYTDMVKLIAEAKDKNIGTSLATFKPTKIKDFVYKAVDREWDRNKLEKLKQINIFEKRGERLEVVKKLPYKFSYIFEDEYGKERKMMIEDWETGQLFWNSLRSSDGDEIKACEKVRQKYLDDLASTKDLHFFLGTTQLHHFTAPNPFIIIGAFYPKHESQLGLF